MLKQASILHTAAPFAALTWRLPVVAHCQTNARAPFHPAFGNGDTPHYGL
jgi:hypothetical protein